MGHKRYTLRVCISFGLPENANASIQVGKQSGRAASRGSRRGTGLKEGDNIEIHVEDSRTLGVRKSPDRRELLARLRRFRGRLPEGFVFDRLEAHERD